MRLIDADKLIDALDDKIIWTNQGWEDVTSVIHEQPTAYDVDKVVKEMETFAECKECRESKTDKRFYYGQGCKACAFGKLIKIVKRGDVE